MMPGSVPPTLRKCAKDWAPSVEIFWKQTRCWATRPVTREQSLNCPVCQQVDHGLLRKQRALLTDQRDTLRVLRSFTSVWTRTRLIAAGSSPLVCSYKRTGADAINAPAHLHLVLANASRTGAAGNDVGVQRDRAIPCQRPAFQIHAGGYCY